MHIPVAEILTGYQHADLLGKIRMFLNSLSREEDGYRLCAVSKRRSHYFRSLRFCISGFYSALTLLDTVLPANELPQGTPEVSRQTRVVRELHRARNIAVCRLFADKPSPPVASRKVADLQRKVGKYLRTDYEHSWIVNRKKEIMRKVTRCKICERNTIPMAHLMDHSKICLRLSRLNKELMNLTNCIISECDNAKHYKVSFDSLYQRKQHDKAWLMFSKAKSGKSIQNRNLPNSGLQGSFRDHSGSATATSKQRRMSTFHRYQDDSIRNKPKELSNQLNTIRSLQKEMSPSPDHTEINLQQGEPSPARTSLLPVSMIKLLPALSFQEDRDCTVHDVIVSPSLTHASPEASPHHQKHLDRIMEESGEAGISPIRARVSADNISRASLEEIESATRPNQEPSTTEPKHIFNLPTISISAPLQTYQQATYNGSIEVFDNIRFANTQPRQLNQHTLAGLPGRQNSLSEESEDEEDELPVDPADLHEPRLTKVKTFETISNKDELVRAPLPAPDCEDKHTGEYGGDLHLLKPSPLPHQHPSPEMDSHSMRGVSVKSNYFRSDDGSQTDPKKHFLGLPPAEPKASRFMQEAMKASKKKLTKEDLRVYTPENRQNDNKLVKQVQIEGLSSDSSLEECEAMNPKYNLQKDLEHIKKCREFFRQVAQ